MNDTPTTCSIPGCEAVGDRRGWCDAHYMRWWRTGDPVPPPRRPAIDVRTGYHQARPATDLSWMDDAACRGMYGLFFTERGESTNQAKAVCARCPVREQCGDYGMGEKFGIWGGLSERERRRIRSGRQKRTAA
jgi:WhiB family redox-sensing transcriptional regulator